MESLDSNQKVYRYRWLNYQRILGNDGHSNFVLTNRLRCAEWMPRRVGGNMFFDLPPWGWVVVCLAAFLIGICKTAMPEAGTLVVALFAMAMPARISTGAMLLLLIVGDVIAVWTYRRDADWKILRSLLPTVVVGIILGAVFVSWADDLVLKRAIGVILLCLIALTITMRFLFRGRKERQQEMMTGNWFVKSFYGVLGGFTIMSANAGGPVMSLYLVSARFSVLRFLGTTAWFFFLINLIKVPFSVGIGLIKVSTLWSTLIMAPLVLLGAIGGRFVAGKMNNQVFDPIVIGLTVVSATLLLV